MALLSFLRLCSYWLFLLSALAFLTMTLLIVQTQDATAAVLHPYFLYSTVLSLLLSISFSVTLWVGRPQEDGTPTPSTTLFLTLGASFLVATMIAAALFFM